MKRFINFVLTAVLVSTLLPAFAELVPTFNYQGRLSNSDGTPYTSTASVSVTLTIYNEEDTSLMSNVYTCELKNGYFNIQFGNEGGMKLADLPFIEQYYLGVKVEGFEEVTPREKLSHVAYAMRAKSAETVDDNAITTAKIKDDAVTNAKIGYHAITSAKLDNGIVITDKIATNAVTTEKIASNAVTNTWTKEETTTKVWSTLGSQLITSQTITLANDATLFVFASSNIGLDSGNPFVISQFYLDLGSGNGDTAEVSIHPDTPSDHVNIMATTFLTAGSYNIKFYINPISISPSGSSFKTNRHKIFIVAFYK